MKDNNWPAWHYGPNGEAKIFHKEADVPKGWHDHPSKHKKAPTDAPKTDSSPGAGTLLDTGGWPWTDGLHAPTKSKTKEGYWRMAVGKKRPDPKPGYPIQHDL
jgi:hypothetical protein